MAGSIEGERNIESFMEEVRHVLDHPSEVEQRDEGSPLRMTPIDPSDEKVATVPSLTLAHRLGEALGRRNTRAIIGGLGAVGALLALASLSKEKKNPPQSKSFVTFNINL